MASTKSSGTPEREPQKVKDIPEAEAFTGSLLLRSEPVEFCPDAFLDRLNFSKESRPVFILRPLSARDRHWMDSDDRRMATGGMTWAKENGVDMADNKNIMLMVNKCSEFSDVEKRCAIIRKSIIGFKNDNGIGKFEKSADDDGLAPEIFERLPDDLVSAIGIELMRMANPTKYEALGL